MKNKGLLCSIVVMLLWGLLFPTVKLGYNCFGISSVAEILTFAGFRFLICGIIISIFSFCRAPKSFEAIKKNWHLILLFGAFSIILHYGFTYIALSVIDGSKTAILKQLGAVFYICFSALFFKDDKITVKKICGLVLGLSGIVAINISSVGFSFNLGDLLIIGASFCTVFANVLGKKLFASVEPIVATGISQLFGGIVLLVCGLSLGVNVATVISKTPKQLLVFAVILIASVISYCLWFLLVKRENLSKLFIIKFAEPLFASVFSWLLLGDNIFNINYMAAFLLISAGIIVANLEKQKI